MRTSWKKIGNIQGQRFGRILVISPAGSNKSRARLWNCICDCGKEIICVGKNLRSGTTNSCGCLCSDINRKLHTTHGKTKTRTYKTWSSVKRRCFCKTSYEYKFYGAKGITMCERWKNSFEAFLQDMGERPEGLTLDRIDNTGNYEPSNCRWATPVQQNRNRSISLPISVADIAKKQGISYAAAYARYKRGTLCQ